MCAPTYPIFRSGSILSADHETTAEEAVAIGRLLRDNNLHFTTKLISNLESRDGCAFRNFEFNQAEGPRIRLQPAITIDFTPLRFFWNDNPIDFRVCMTAWSGKRKAKIWTRYNFVELQKSKKNIPSFFAICRNEDQIIHDFCANFYRDIVAEINTITLEPIYRICIQMLSTRNDKIKDIIESTSDAVRDKDNIRIKDFEKTVLEELQNEYGVSLVQPAPNTRRLIKSFSYPINSIEWLVDNDLQTDDIGMQGMLVDSVLPQEVQAVCIVDTGDTDTEVTGLVYESKRAKDFRRSGPHIVSSELSYELGNAF